MDNGANLTFPVFRLGEMYLNFTNLFWNVRRGMLLWPAGYEELAMEKWADLRDRAG